MGIGKALGRVGDELGIKALKSAGKDVWIIIISRCLRGFAYGSVGLILALHLSELGFSDSKIGLFMTLTLFGDCLISLLLTQIADKIGRRLVLFIGALLMSAAGAVFALFSNYWILLMAAIFGVISVAGNDIGPFKAIGESTAAHIVPQDDLSYIYQWIIAIATAVPALGLFSSGWIVNALTRKGWPELDAYRSIFWIYAGLGVCKAVLALCMSRKSEVHDEEETPPLSSTVDDEQRPLLADRPNSITDRSVHSSQRSTKDKRKELLFSWKSQFSIISKQAMPTLIKIAVLFAIDSIASGMVPWSLVNYYIDKKFNISKSTLGTVMSLTWFLSGFFNIFAGSPSKRIGLIRTMVFAHLPSAIFLALTPLPHSLAWTIVLLLGRGCLNSMDQAPRSAFISKVFGREERTAVMGLLNVVKTLSQSGGPVITGTLAASGRFWIAFLVAGVLKGFYDLGLMALFASSDNDGTVESGEDGPDEDGDSTYGSNRSSSHSRADN